MKAQLMFSMLFMLALATASALLTAALFCGVIGSSSRGTSVITQQHAAAEDALRNAAGPFSESHIIIDGR
jgi:hypothetical protein